MENKCKTLPPQYHKQFGNATIIRQLDYTNNKLIICDT